MDAALRSLVRRRASDRCEYCHLPQECSGLAAFHIEHVIPRQHQGATEADNLALACHRCNLHKGPNLTGLDPVTRLITPLFNPRTQVWSEHFELEGASIVGLTPTGRTMVQVLAMKSVDRLELRSEVRAEGFPLE